MPTFKIGDRVICNYYRGKIATVVGMSDDPRIVRVRWEDGGENALFNWKLELIKGGKSPVEHKIFKMYERFERRKHVPNP